MKDNTETLFIADDEFSIREGLKCIIDWESLGFHLCGEAANGEDALAQILALQPSLVLLDVKMPRMHGTEVIRRARELGFTGKCIILSGYSDFKYAQDAIRSGVSFYLTKPLDEDELLDTVMEIRDLLFNDKQRTDTLAQLKQRAKNVILQEILTGTASLPSSKEPVAVPRLSPEDTRNMGLCADRYQVVICENFNESTDAAPYTFAELLRITNKDNNTFEHLEIDTHDVVLLKGAYGLRKLSDFLAHFDDQTPQEGSPLGSIFLTIGRPVSSLDEISLSYKDASELLHRRFFCMQGQHYLDYDMLPEAAKIPPPTHFSTLGDERLSHYTGRFINYISTFNRKMTVASLSELESELSHALVDIGTIRLFCIDLYLHIKEQAILTYPYAAIPFDANSAVIEFIDKQHYLYEIIRYLSEQFEMIMNSTGNPSRDTILDDVLFYIDHNYQNNIKLETIAPLFGYNSAYLGKIFSKSVGENFNSYIDHKRIERSKELLCEKKWKVYEIATQVGYKNVDYFHKKFKKYVGESPAEYRKHLEAP